MWSSTRNFAGCRSDSSLTPDRQASHINEITAKGSLDGKRPHSTPSSKGAESNVTCADRVCMAALHQVPRQFHRAAPIKRALPRLSICRSATFGEAGNPSASSAEKCRHGSESRLIGVSVRWRLAVELSALETRHASSRRGYHLPQVTRQPTSGRKPALGRYSLMALA